MEVRFPQTMATIALIGALGILASGCGGPAIRHEIFWADDSHALFQAEPEAKVGDRFLVKRTALLVHPANQQVLGRVEETFGDVRVSWTTGHLAAIEVADLPPLHAGDQVILQERASGTPKPPAQRVGQIEHVDPATGELTIRWSQPASVSSGEVLGVGIPREVVFLPESHVPAAVKFTLAAQIELQGPSRASSPLAVAWAVQKEETLVPGDGVYRLRTPPPTSWLDGPDPALVDHLLFERPYQLALERFNAGDFAAALEHLRVAKSARPNHVEVALLMGLCYQQLGDDERAIAAWEATLSQNPQHLELLILLAQAYLSRGDLKTSLDLYERCLPLEPNNVGLWLDAAELYYQAGNIPKSLELLRRVLELEPENAEAKAYQEMLQQEALR